MAERMDDSAWSELLHSSPDVQFGRYAALDATVAKTRTSAETNDAIISTTYAPL